MKQRKTLEQVLQELKEAEKEYKEKCIKYGIEEKHKRKKPDENVEGENSENQVNEENNQEENSKENDETASEN